MNNSNTANSANIADKTQNLVEMATIRRTFHDGERELIVLNNLSLCVKKGESLAILGKSGSGKSTLLQIMGLLDTQTEGKYILNGDDVSALPDRKRNQIRNCEIGFVFQHFHLLPELSALENALLPARLAGKATENRENVRKLMQKLELGDRLRHKPSRLSGGEKQRVAIARALSNSPALLLCDEPTGNLDNETAVNVADQLFALQQESGATLVIVTHDRDIATRADRVLNLEKGVLSVAL